MWITIFWMAIFVLEAPLARTHSMCSYSGYHTPIEDEENGSLINEPSELPSEMNGVVNVQQSRGSLLVNEGCLV